jgi:hypothetical protein
VRIPWSNVKKQHNVTIYNLRLKCGEGNWEVLGSLCDIVIAFRLHTIHELKIASAHYSAAAIGNIVGQRLQLVDNMKL